MPTLPTVIIPGQPGHIGHHETLHAWHNRTIDAVDFGIESWESTLGLNATSGSPFITNTARPFDADDIGKKVIINRIAGGATKFYAEIVDVSGSTAEMDVNADFTVVGQRVQWGFDQTDLINNAFDELAAATSDRRILRFPRGLFRATRILVPTSVGWVGEGWGNPILGSTTTSWAGAQTTIFKQLPDYNDDFVRFGMFAAASSSIGYCLYDRIQDFILEGPETNIPAYPYSAGGGMVFKTNDGTHDLMPQDQCFMERVAANFFFDDGFAGPLGPVPNAYQNLRAFYNGRYGFNWEGGNCQAVHLLNFSGDGNSEGLIRVADLQPWMSLIVTALKSEMGNVEEVPTGSSNYQENALILDNVEASVLILGLNHISSLHSPPADTGTVFQAPGAAIKIIATSPTNIPTLTWFGVGVRDHAVANNATTEVGGPGPVLEDAFNGITIPQEEMNGTYGAGAETHYLDIGGLLPITGTPAYGTVGAGRRRALLFDGAADESAAGEFIVPDGWNSFTATIEWCNAAAGSGDVVWLFQGDDYAEGDDLSVADTLNISGIETAGAQNILVETTTTTDAACVGGRLFCYRIKRVAASDAADTLGNDAALLGLRLTRAT